MNLTEAVSNAPAVVINPADPYAREAQTLTTMDYIAMFVRTAASPEPDRHAPTYQKG
jgi:hypothetical protein